MHGKCCICNEWKEEEENVRDDVKVRKRLEEHDHFCCDWQGRFYDVEIISWKKNNNCY